MEYTVFERSFLKAIGPDPPILLVYDGHFTHISIKLIEMASKENVTILKLTPSYKSWFATFRSQCFQAFKNRMVSKISMLSHEEYWSQTFKID